MQCFNHTFDCGPLKSSFNSSLVGGCGEKILIGDSDLLQDTFAALLRGGEEERGWNMSIDHKTKTKKRRQTIMKCHCF